MDNHRMHFDRFSITDLYQRIQKTWNHPSSAITDPETLSVLKSIAGILGAIALAWIAKTETQNRQRLETLRSEWPHPKIWNSWMHHQGWTRIERPQNPRSLPSIPATGLPSIYMSRDQCLILIAPSPYSEPTATDMKDELWSCEPKPSQRLKTVQWDKIGSGFEGVNRLAGSIEKAPQSPSKKQPLRIDPREIRY